MITGYNSPVDKNTVEKKKVVFLGTPEFAVASLSALIQSPHFEVVGVVTQPDRPAGRGETLTAPPVKVLALEHRIPVFQPISLKSLVVVENEHVGQVDKGQNRRPKLFSSKSAAALADFLNSLHRLDVMVTAAYGCIIPPSLIHYIAPGIINVHPSLLPRWRGPAPLQHSIFSGDLETGVCLMKAHEGVDTGPVFCSRIVQMSPDTTLGQLHDELSLLGANLLIEHLAEIVDSKTIGVLQDESGATYAPKWSRDDATINWNDPAIVTYRRIQASCPTPGARTLLSSGETMKIYKASVVDASIVDNASAADAVPGTIINSPKGTLHVMCGDGNALSIEEAQMPGRKRLNIKDLMMGYSFLHGSTI